MAKREIVLTHNAEGQLHEILETFRVKTKTVTRSANIYKMFKNHLTNVAEEPDAGIKTAVKGVRGVYVQDYIIFYEDQPEKIIVLKISDCCHYLESSEV